MRPRPRSRSGGRPLRPARPPVRAGRARPGGRASIPRAGDIVADMELVRAYSVLGVGRGASQHEVREAYRTQLLKNHPDAGGAGDPVALSEIRSAYRAVVALGAAPGAAVGAPRRAVDTYA